MANICTFKMKAIGPDKDIKNFCNELNNNMTISNENDGIFFGYCDWSVYYHLSKIKKLSLDNKITVEFISESTDDMLKEDIIINEGEVIYHKDYMFVKPDKEDYDGDMDLYLEDLDYYKELSNMDFNI